MATKIFKKATDNCNLSDLPDLNFGPVLLFNESLNDKKLETIKIRHPKTGLLSSFLHCRDTLQIFEIHKFDDQFRSWMIGDLILKDGSLHIITQVNPIFLLLPYLIKNEGRYMELESMLHDNDTPVFSSFTAAYFPHLSSVTLSKEVQGNLFYKYHRTNSLQWLKLKVESLEIVLSEEKVNHCTHASVLPGFEGSMDQKVDQEGLRRYAWELVSEYLSEHLAEEVREALQLPVVTTEKKASCPDDQPHKKKMKMGGPTEDYSIDNAPVQKKAAKLTTAQKKLSKVDKEGIKNISSFFTKPVTK